MLQHPYNLQVRRVIDGATAMGQPLNHQPFAVAKTANLDVLTEAALAITQHCSLEGSTPGCEEDRYVTQLIRLLIEYMLQPDGSLYASDTFSALIQKIVYVVETDMRPYPHYDSFLLLKMRADSPGIRAEQLLSGLHAVLERHAASPAVDDPPPIVWTAEGYYLCCLVSPLQIFEEGLAWGNRLAFQFSVPLNEHSIAYPDCLASLTAYAEVKAGLQLLSFRKQGRRIALFGFKNGRAETPFERPRARDTSFEAQMFRRALRDVAFMYRPRRKPMAHPWMHLRLPPLLSTSMFVPALQDTDPAQLSFSW